MIRNDWITIYFIHLSSCNKKVLANKQKSITVDLCFVSVLYFVLWFLSPSIFHFLAITINFRKPLYVIMLLIYWAKCQMLPAGSLEVKFLSCFITTSPPSARLGQIFVADLKTSSYFHFWLLYYLMKGHTWVIIIYCCCVHILLFCVFNLSQTPASFIGHHNRLIESWKVWRNCW